MPCARADRPAASEARVIFPKAKFRLKKSVFAIEAFEKSRRKETESSRSMAVHDEEAEKTRVFRSKFACQSTILVARVVGSVGTCFKVKSKGGRAAISPLSSKVDRACMRMDDGLTHPRFLLLRVVPLLQARERCP